MLKKKICFYLFSCSLLFIAHAEEPKKSFVIQQKSKTESTNRLKEHVGESVQKTLKQVTALQKQTAQLMEQLAETQQQLLKAGSSILKDKKEFKKASKESLAQAEITINRLRTHLDEGSRMVNIILKQTEKNNLNTTSCFKLSSLKLESLEIKAAKA
ncbi:hypothetical protein COB28_02900 [Candidatus Dependentiae bacterium]|nr:MAG: hypothetical protein COB28_02900 [Candidatus Dependentiae bacterium]